MKPQRAKVVERVGGDRGAIDNVVGRRESRAGGRPGRRRPSGVAGRVGGRQSPVLLPTQAPEGSFSPAAVAEVRWHPVFWRPQLGNRTQQNRLFFPGN